MSEPRIAAMPKPHWVTVVADRIVIASGYCWCDGSGGHRIALRAPANHEVRGGE